MPDSRRTAAGADHCIHRAFALPDPQRILVLRLFGEDILRVLVYRDAAALRRACASLTGAPARHPLGAVFAARRPDTFAVMLLCSTHLTAEVIAHECLHVVALAARKRRLRMRNRGHEEWLASLMGALCGVIDRELRRPAARRGTPVASRRHP